MSPHMIPANFPVPDRASDRNYGKLAYYQVDQILAVHDHEPATEQEFLRRRDQFGSMYAFHGTGADCIYSLQRNGLRNLSNSNYMTAGAAYGQGIYISSNLGMAEGYAKSTTSSFRGRSYHNGSYQSYGGAGAQAAQIQNSQFYENIRRAEISLE